MTKVTRAAEKAQSQREESSNEAKCGIMEPEAAPRGCKKKVFIDARGWEGHDLNLAVGRGALTIEHSIVRRRQAIGKEQTDKADDEFVDAMWQYLLGEKRKVGERA